MYYPGVTDRQQATVIRIGEGEWIEDYDLRMPALPLEYAVEGKVVWPDGRPVDNAKVIYVVNSVQYPVSVNSSGHFSFKTHEGVKISINGYVETSDGKRLPSRWVEIVGNTTKLELVIVPN